MASLGALVLVLQAGCSLLGDEGSGVLVTRPIQVGPTVERVEVGDAFTAVIQVGSATPSASVRIDDNLVEHLVAEVEDDVVRVELSGRVRDATLRLEVALPTMSELRVSGAAEVEVRGVVEDEAEIVASDASRVVVDGLELDGLRLELSGASSLEAGGLAASIEAEVSGASRLDLIDVDAETVAANVSGASTVDVTVSELLEADASGASTIRYRGDPDRVRVDSSGSSTVERAAGG